MEDLAALQLPANSTVQALEQQFAAITQPARFFASARGTALATLASLQAALPDWLNAPAPPTAW
ncbi:hypothetical protein BZ164_01470, partial [Pseudomonas veronii]